jgi:hypothetical protein
LQDRSGFADAVEYTNATDAWIRGALLVGVVALAYNLLSTVLALVGTSNWGDFLAVFLSSVATPISIFAVYGPFVCVVVASVAWVVKRRTLPASLDAAHQEYLDNGFLADVWVTGGEVKVLFTRYSIVAYARPGYSQRSVTEFGEMIAAASQNAKNPDNRAMIESLNKIPNAPTSPLLATKVDKTFPSDLWLTLSLSKNSNLGVVGKTKSPVLASKPVVLIDKGEKNPVVYYIKNGVPLD